MVVAIKLGSSIYGISVSKIRELTVPGPITPLPLKPEWCLGLVHYKGRVLPVLSLPGICGEAAESGPGICVVLEETIQGKKEWMALWTNHVDGMYEECDFTAQMGTQIKGERLFIEKVLQGEKTIFVLDTEKLFALLQEDGEQ